LRTAEIRRQGGACKNDEASVKQRPRVQKKFVLTRARKQRLDSFSAALLTWFEAAKRAFPWRPGAGPPFTPWQLLVTEILLQQTDAERVSKHVADVLRLVPTAEAIPRRARLEAVLAPLGLQRQRADRLLALAAEVRRRGEVPSDPESLRKLPGVGDYVADAYSAVFFSTPVVAVDVNVARVISRLLGLEPAPFRAAIASLRRATRHMASQPRNAERVVDLNWALLDFGATICTARRPACGACFAGPICAQLRASLPNRTQPGDKTA
jgi:A/G-specific adenine glycosylase